MDDLSFHSSHIDEECAELQHRCEELEDINSKLNAHKLRCEMQCNELIMKLETKAAEIDSLKEKLETVSKRNNVNKETTNYLRDSLESVKNDLNRADENLSDTNKKVTVLNTKCIDLIDEKELNERKWHAVFEKKEQDMVIILNDAAREKGDYEQKILLLNAEVTATKLEAQEDAKKSEKCKMDLQYELHEIQNCFEKEKEKVAKCQEELKGQQLALNEAMDENRDLNVKIDFLNNTLDQLTDQLKTTNEGNEVLKDELNSERERFSFLDEKLREEGRKYESLLNVKAKSDKAFFDMKKKRADMEKKLQVTRKEFQNLQEDASKQLKRWQEVQNQREKSRMDDAIIVDEKEKYTGEIILMKQDMSLEF